MRNFKSKKGFTLMETLAVVAIIGVLAFLITVSVIDYLRSTTKLEYDGYAKSIFVAAQNHLTMAEHEGYLGRTYFGISEDTTKGVYRFVVQQGEDKDWLNGARASEGSILDLMLPFGSVDEAVRHGSYIIRYQKAPAQVLDVFYWDENGRYAYTYSESDYTEVLLPNKDDKDELRNHDGAVIGYYGGADAKDASGEKLKAPQLELINAEKLYVLVDNPVENVQGASMKLVVRGLSSGNVKEFALNSNSAEDSYYDSSLNKFMVVLDGITTVVNADTTRASAEHFSQVCEDLIPGENILVYAVAYNDTVFTNIAYSSEQTTNSLFADLQELAQTRAVDEEVESEDDDIDDEEKTPTISISNIRHLENMDSVISKFIPSQLEYDNIAVIQTTDLDWNDFLNSVYSTEPERVAVYDLSKPGCYHPISPDYTFSYDGDNHTVRNLMINSSSNEYAGMFGIPNPGVSISNLKLEDSVVNGGVAGTLAGKLEHCTVSNVLAYQSKDAGETVGVIASSGYAGGLIGELLGNSKVDACAANVYVRCTSNSSDPHGAGGLIGMSQGDTITSSYSAGFTIGGVYSTAEDSFNVKADDGSVGGLIADVYGSEIQYCYSTCSVFGKVVGGFVGTSSGSIENCYCTGLVVTPESTPEQPIRTTCGAFAADLSEGASVSGNNYFSAITYPTDPVGSSRVSTEGIMAFDRDTVSYHEFVSYGDSAEKKRAPANPCDETLGAYYQGMYNLRTVRQLVGNALDSETYFVDTHYGDWPAPEIMIINMTESGN